VRNGNWITLLNLSVSGRIGFIVHTLGGTVATIDGDLLDGGNRYPVNCIVCLVASVTLIITGPLLTSTGAYFFTVALVWLFVPTVYPFFLDNVSIQHLHVSGGNEFARTVYHQGEDG
jgi:hypothetical protein